MSRPAHCILATLLLLTTAWADDPPVVIRTVTTDGKPVAKATVWVYEYRDSAEDQAEPKPLVTDAAGKVSFPAGDSRKSQVVFARDTDGRIGSEFVGNWRYNSDADPANKLVLVATTGRSGRVVGPDGKPVVGAVVTPQSFSLADERRRASAGLPYGVMLPPWEMKRLAAKTDADGRFQLLATAADYRPFFRVKADGFGESKWSAPDTGDLDLKLSVNGTVAVAASGVEAATVKGVQVRLTPTDQAAETRGQTAGVQAVRWASGTLDADGQATVADVAPGRYELTVQPDPKLPAVFMPGPPVEVAAGKTAEATLKFGPAAKVTGKITAPDTGQGISGALVSVTIGDGPSAQPKQWLHAQTDADGVFTVHGPAGWYRFSLNTPPDGYVLPPRNPRGEDPVKPVMVEVGKSHEFPAYQLVKAVSFAGVVVNTDGKPAEGATVQIAESFDSPRAGKVVSDKDGKFTLKSLPPDDAIAPRVRLGKAVNVPQTFDLSRTTGPERIEIGEANAAGLTGRVTDTAGKPVAGARVSLLHSIQGVGRHAQYGTRRQVETKPTDADGRYAFGGYWPKDRYGVQVKAAGYADGEAKDVFGDAGRVREFPVIKLTRANLTVAGTVVGLDGRPVAGAEVFQVDGPDRTAAKTAADGTFTLVGFRDTAGFVFARKDGFRPAAVPVFPAKPERVTVRLIPADAPPPPAPPVSAAHKAALDKLTKHLLTRLWDTREKLGYGVSAIDRMAQLDPDAAKRWAAAEKQRTGGKTDYTKRVDTAGARKRLLELARTDIDEAVAAIAAMSASDGFFEATRVGRELLATDQAKALRLAEEAVQKARQRELPDKVWSLAEAGALAASAGGASGKKILLEAAELAAKLTPDENGRNGMNVGMVAARLAPHDLPKAEGLLNTLKAPGDYNRFLSATVARLAPTDLARAKGLLDKFKPDNSYYPQSARMQAAVAVAAEKPDEALELVNGIRDVPHRVQGLVRLAVAFARTDKQRAVKTVDAAFDLMERDAEGFRSWSNYGGRGGFAVLAAAHAAQIGHPDATTLAARALGMRSAGNDAHSPESRDEHLVNFAAVLAIADPAAARHVLAGIAPLDEFVTKALSSRRDWLFALALADPDRARTLVDKLIDRALAGRGGSAVSQAGLSELTLVLLADDKLKELAVWASLPFGRDYE